MELRNTLVVLALLLAPFTGCKSVGVPTYFEPVTHLKERTFGDGAYVTTLHTSVWMNDIDDFLKRAPVGSYSYNAVLTHERVHSIRMGNLFSTGWFVLCYSLSTDFMWEEEQLGWYFEFMYRKQRGILKPIDYVARTLSNYSNLFGKMVSYSDALVWVEAVYAGNWKPKLSQEELDLYSAPKAAK